MYARSPESASRELPAIASSQASARVTGPSGVPSTKTVAGAESVRRPGPQDRGAGRREKRSSSPDSRTGLRRCLVRRAPCSRPARRLRTRFHDPEERGFIARAPFGTITPTRSPGCVIPSAGPGIPRDAVIPRLLVEFRCRSSAIRRDRPQPVDRGSEPRSLREIVRKAGHMPGGHLHVRVVSRRVMISFMARHRLALPRVDAANRLLKQRSSQSERDDAMMLR